MPTLNYVRSFCLLPLPLLCAAALAADVTTPGGHRVWEALTLDVRGPDADEYADDNPFRNVRMTVTFTCGDARYVVSGYFAADGNAAETGAAAGNVWRARFVPDRPGEWAFAVSLRGGMDIALGDDAGTAAPGDGESGTFVVAENLQSPGMLRYTGGRYLQWSGNGRYFLKSGVDSPENLLAYNDFDGTHSNRAEARAGEARGGRLHTFGPHFQDWRSGDPIWRGLNGKGIIGAVNYLASQGVNSVYFVTLNIDGDGEDVWPYNGDFLTADQFDCSKLDQWEILFAHLDRHGFLLHVVLTETENESWFEFYEPGEFASTRKLYYRELIARFAHHHAIEWNIGEENGSTPKDAPADAPDRENTDSQRNAFAEFIRRLDPYDHPIVVHTHPGKNWYEKVYAPLLGHDAYEGASLQVSGGDVYAITREWLRRSQEAGRPWFVCLDELGPADTGVKPDADDPAHDGVRQEVLWANLMAGGSGCEWYFGYKFAHNDLNCEDFRSREEMYRQTRIATEFFQRHVPFAEMAPLDDAVRGAKAWCLAKPADAYLVYLPRRADVEVRLPGHEYDVRWFNPRLGGELQTGSRRRVTGGDWTAIGRPLGDDAGDWAALLTRVAGAVSGTIRVRGEIPESEAGAGHEIPDESLIVGEQWGLANVFVYLPEAPEGFASPVLFESTVTIDIADGRFVPHALIIRTPVTVRARSRDPEAYNPQLYGIRNPPVGLILSPEGPAPQRLPKPEFVPLAMTCDIHPQMRAWVLPLDHPFAALTGRDGAFRIDGLPPGEHTFRVWHERSGWLEKALNVSIEAGNEAQVTLEYGASRFSEREP